MITFLQAIILGIVQGVTSLFPVSGLGHSLLVADLLRWHNILGQAASSSSALYSFLAISQLAVAIALILFYRQTWAALLGGLRRSLQQRAIPAHDSNARLAYVVLIATVVACLLWLIFGRALQTQVATSFFAIVFIIVNGIILLKEDKPAKVLQGDRPRRRRQPGEVLAANRTSQLISDHIDARRAALFGALQLSAVLPGLSRVGLSMVVAMRSGLDRQTALRFSFLLTTPLLFIAGLSKLSVLWSAHAASVRGQTLLGAVIAGIVAYFAVRFLDTYFTNRTLRPFGLYCIIAGCVVLLASVIHGAS
jgi:undecaprenyl-diphosphatase